MFKTKKWKDLYDKIPIEIREGVELQPRTGNWKDLYDKLPAKVKEEIEVQVKKDLAEMKAPKSNNS